MPCVGVHALGQVFHLGHGPEEQGAVEVEDLRLRRQARGQAFSAAHLHPEQGAHAPDEEHARQHQPHFHGHRQVEHHREDEGTEQHGAVGQVEAPGVRERAPFAHVPGHEQQDAGQRGQRHVQGQGCGHQHHPQQREGVHHAGHGAGGPCPHIRHSAGDGAGSWHAAEQRAHHVGHALRHQFLVRVMARVLGHVVGHAGAQQRLNGAEQRDGQGGHQQLLDAHPTELWQGEGGQRLGDTAKARADGFQRQLQYGGQRGGPCQRHDGAWHVGGLAPEAGPGALWCRVHLVRLGPQHHHGRAAQPHQQCRGVERVQVRRQHADLGEEVGRQLVDLQAQQVLDLRQPDQYGNAIGEADDDGHRDVADQRPQAQPAHQEQQHPGQGGGDEQVGQSVALHDAVDDDDEGPGRPADLHMRAAQRRDQKARDDGGEQAGLRLDARGDGKGHGQG